MTLHILIHRQTREEPNRGYLRAWVVQEGLRGEELLKGKTKNVLTAKQTIERRMQRDAPGCAIRWSVEDYVNKPTEATEATQ